MNSSKNSFKYQLSTPDDNFFWVYAYNGIFPINQMQKIPHHEFDSCNNPNYHNCWYALYVCANFQNEKKRKFALFIFEMLAAASAAARLCHKQTQRTIRKKNERNKKKLKKERNNKANIKSGGKRKTYCYI
jgi:hypothetical protein